MPEIPTVTVDGVPNPLPADLPLLDVREKEEWDAGHVEGAIHVPLSLLPLRLDEVPSGQVLVTCKAGGRSAQAVSFLSQQGRDVVSLDGGMLAWETAGRPMVSENGRAPEVV